MIDCYIYDFSIADSKYFFLIEKELKPKFIQLVATAQITGSIQCSVRKEFDSCKQYLHILAPLV